eukprot:TRINITY_DN1985_c1_g2_i1.p1 TRINITY_DN1985_c1_g2~~TRINITY_DN1985_c1_g2_i1.p1  ORF type:complete len:889 (+),score=150.97 TRINITY_DN1985_c1_g2_i1:55-2667(+)
MTAAPKRFILPDAVKPTNYKLAVDTDLEKFTFLGDVTIEAVVKEPCNEIVLNSLGLKYTSDAEIHNGRTDVTEKIKVSDLGCNEKDERLTFKLAEKTQAGDVLKIRLQYSGELLDNLKGFYRSNYVDENGETQWLATTQCEPTDARRILPCWDEPELKATFETELIIPPRFDALSNMGEISRKTLPNGKTHISFAKTPKMSSYLLAFVIGKFAYIEETFERHGSKQPCRCRVYAFAGKESQGKLALETTVKSLMWYEEFFKVDYPLDKCDLIAIPDFPTLAMENWGLVTYREVGLLCTDQSSTSSKSMIVLVVAHELAHQWFGNLVTMQWWKELWLNESFATYMEFLVSDLLHPEWELWSDFVTQDYDSALTLDSLLTSHPVEIDVSLAQEIDEIFDGISYSKGCALMRMCITWIGMDSFKQAMRTYMSTHSYGNATTIDLWTALSTASGKPVGDVMRDWTAIQGYPFLTCSRPSPDKVVIKQKRFLSLSKDDTDANNHLWTIPIISSDAPDTVVLLPAEETFTLSVDPKASFIKLNLGQTALCRVLYDDKMLSDLAKEIKSGKLSNIDLGGILNDIAAFSSKGLISATQVLELAPAFNFSTDSSIISGLLSLFYDISHALKDSPENRKKFDLYKIKVFKPIYDSLGLEHKEGDSDKIKQSRGQVVGMMASSGEETALKFLREKFSAFLKSGDESELPSDYRSSGYCSLIKHGDSSLWKEMKSHFEKTTDATEKVRALRALGCTSDKALIQESLQYAISESVKQQDSSYLLNTVARRNGLTEYFEFIKTNYEKLFKKCEGAPTQLEHYCGGLDSFNSEKGAAEVKAWWDSLKPELKTIERHISQSLETIAIATAYYTREFDNIVAFLGKQ